MKEKHLPKQAKDFLIHRFVEVDSTPHREGLEEQLTIPEVFVPEVPSEAEEALRVRLHTAKVIYEAKRQVTHKARKQANNHEGK